jgi:hypothetical protein
MTPIYSKELRTDYLFLLNEVINDIINNNRVYDDEHMYMCVTGLKTFGCTGTSDNYRKYIFFIEANQSYFCHWYINKGYELQALRPVGNGVFLRTTEISNYKTINNIRFVYLNHLYDLLNMDL